MTPELFGLLVLALIGGVFTGKNERKIHEQQAEIDRLKKQLIRHRHGECGDVMLHSLKPLGEK